MRAAQLTGLVLLAVVGLMLVLLDVPVRLGLPAQMSGFFFVLFLSPLLAVLTQLGQQARARRAAGPDAVQPAAAPVHPRGALRDAGPDEAAYWWDHALGRLPVLADRAAAEADAPLEQRRVEATTASLRQVRAHLLEARDALAASDVDTAEEHYRQALALVGSWRPGSDLAAHLEGTGRSLFGLDRAPTRGRADHPQPDAAAMGDLARLVDRVVAERALPPAQRPTGARDASLDEVGRMLQGARRMLGDGSRDGAASRLRDAASVAGSWAQDAPLTRALLEAPADLFGG